MNERLLCLPTPRLKATVHLRGVNLRLLALVRRGVPSARQDVRAACLAQMAARAARRCLCRDWRAIEGHSGLVSGPAAVAASWLNRLLGLPRGAGGDSCSFFWRIGLKERINAQSQAWSWPTPEGGGGTRVSDRLRCLELM